MSGDYGLEDYIASSNDAYEKGIPREAGEIAYVPPPPSQGATKNVVKNWADYQGYYYATSDQIRRHLDVRRVTIENSGGTNVVAAIFTLPRLPRNTVTILLKPRQTLVLGMNLRDDPVQYVVGIDPTTRKDIGIVREIPSDATNLVFREGHNGWFVQTFKNVVF